MAAGEGRCASYRERGGYGTQPVIERVLRALAQEPNFPPSSARPEYPCARACRARACRARTRKQKKWNRSARRKTRVRKRTHARTHARGARAPSAFTHARMARARVYLDSVCTGPPCTDSHEDHIRTRCGPCRHRPMLSARRQTLQNRSGATNVPTRRSGGLAGAAHGVTF